MAVWPMFRVTAVLGGLAKPYATMIEDTAAMIKLIVAGQMCFYTLLFSVKMSLLTLYRKLLTGLPGVYKKIWWAIVSFCMIVSHFFSHWFRVQDAKAYFRKSWIGSVFSSIFTCDDLKTKYAQGRCVGTANENDRIIFSLYFAYSVDVATDFASMLNKPLTLHYEILISDSNVSTNPTDLESPTTTQTEDGCLRAVRQRLHMYRFRHASCCTARSRRSWQSDYT
jgi:hypothetical protein